jgi:hypothetical protein
VLEVLLFTADCPVFRSYSWIRPSFSCGYFTLGRWWFRNTPSEILPAAELAEEYAV